MFIGQHLSDLIPCGTLLQLCYAEIAAGGGEERTVAACALRLIAAVHGL